MIYLGTLGSMIGLRCPASQSVEHADRVSVATTLEGRVKAQVRPLGRRTWSAAVSEATTPADQAAILGFLGGEWGPGPFVFVGADAPHTNLLTPDQASCHPDLVYGDTNASAGPLLCGDRWAGRSYLADPSAYLRFGSNVQTPVIPGQHLTASAWVRGTEAGIRVNFYREDGTYTLVTGDTITTGTNAARATVTAVVPDDAVGVRMMAFNATQGASPAITWTDRVQPWAAGEGCLSAVIHAGSKDITMAAPGLTYGSVSFTITEVG